MVNSGYATDQAFRDDFYEAGPDTGKKVALIGGLISAVASFASIWDQVQF